MKYSDVFLTINVLKEILNEYEWPLEYNLKEYADEVKIEFPKCTIIVTESFESKMYASFLNSQTGRSDIQRSLNVYDAVDVLQSINPQVGQELKLKGLLRDVDDEPSLEVVIQGLHNICILLQAYLLPCIKGDFSWVEEFNKMYPGV